MIEKLDNFHAARQSIELTGSRIMRARTNARTHTSTAFCDLSSTTKNGNEMKFNRRSSTASRSAYRQRPTSNQHPNSNQFSYKSKPDAFNWKSFYFSILICLLISFIESASSMGIQNSSDVYRVQSVQTTTIDFTTNSKQLHQSDYRSNGQRNVTQQLRKERVQATNKVETSLSQLPVVYQLFDNSSKPASLYYQYDKANDKNIDLLATKPSLVAASYSSVKPDFTDHATNRTLINLTNSEQSTGVLNRSDGQLNRFANSDTVDKSAASSANSAEPNNVQATNRSDIENKMKRRFAENEQQPSATAKKFNQEDLKNYILKTQDKMQKWDQYQTNFTTLKKQILNSTNSSFPISRHTKSTLRQYNHENGLPSSIILQPIDNQNSIVNNMIDEYDLLPDNDKPRYMDYKSFCDKCYCTGLKSSNLKCNKNNQIKFIPILPYDKRSGVTEIFIENQDHFHELNEEQLKYYPNITKLTIQNSGLREVKEKTFKSTPALKVINLKHNQLKTLQRKLFDDLHFEELSINGNPFTCSCNVKWIKLWLSKPDDERLGVSGQNITCIDYSNSTKYIKEIDWKGCELPVVKVNVTTISVREGNNFTILCNATGDPIPSITWDTKELKSKYNLTTIFNPVNMNGSNVTVLPSITVTNATSNATSKKNKTMTKIIDVFNANPYDNGPFYCYGENIIGRVAAVVNVSIAAAPKILELKTEERFFMCACYNITGHPRPTRTWYFNKRLINFQNQTLYNDTIQPYPRYRKNTFITTGCLCINSESHAHSGDYTLQLENEIGKVNQTILVNIINLPSDQMKMPSSKMMMSPQNTGRQERSPNNYTSVIVIGILILLLVIFCVTCVLYQGCEQYVKKRNKDNLIVPQTKITNHSCIVENQNYLQDKQQQMLNNFKDRQIDSKRIQTIKELGEGAFGRVYLGTVKDLEITQTRTLVAVKVLKHMPEQLTTEFEQEAELLLELSHENIVTFYGVSIDQHPYMMIFEYMKLGDLNSFLRSFKECQSDPNIFRKTTYSQLTFNQTRNSWNLPVNNNNVDETKDPILSNENYIQKLDQPEEEPKECDALIRQDTGRKISIREKKSSTSEELRRSYSESQPIIDELVIEDHKVLDISDLYSISKQVCNGMRYLAQQHFVHRDLATRNCLVTKENDKLIIKIGDFGMSRDVYSSDYYKVGKTTVLPIRWMPPESIMYRKFTLESDIWSYGVLLWEVWTIGKQPFFELNNIEVIQQVVNGKRLERPKHCPNGVYELMQKCWRNNVNDRASMAELYNKLNQLHQLHNESVVQESRTQENGVQESGIQESVVYESIVHENKIKETGIQVNEIKETGIHENEIKETGIQVNEIQETGIKETGIQESVL